MLTDAFCQCVIGTLYTLPAIITIHRVIAASHGCNLSNTNLIALLLQLFQELQTGSRRSITAIHKAMHIDILQTVSLRQLQQGIQMRIVAVHAAIGKQSPQMQGTAAELRCVAGSLQMIVIIKITVLNGLCDFRQILIYDASGSHIQMADLGIAHLTFRQTDA